MQFMQSVALVFCIVSILFMFSILIDQVCEIVNKFNIIDVIKFKTELSRNFDDRNLTQIFELETNYRTINNFKKVFGWSKSRNCLLNFILVFLPVSIPKDIEIEDLYN